MLSFRPTNKLAKAQQTQPSNLLVHIKTIWFIPFSTKYPLCKTFLRLNRCLIKVKIKTLQLFLCQFCNHSCLFFIALYFQVIDIHIAAIAIISCWQLYRKPFSRTSFLTKHFNKKLTITQIVIIIIIAYNSKRRKTNKFNRSFEQFEKYTLCQIWNTLAKYFWGIGSKGGSFVKYRLWH